MEGVGGCILQSASVLHLGTSGPKVHTCLHRNPPSPRELKSTGTTFAGMLGVKPTDNSSSVLFVNEVENWDSPEHQRAHLSGESGSVGLEGGRDTSGGGGGGKGNGLSLPGWGLVSVERENSQVTAPERPCSRRTTGCDAFLPAIFPKDAAGSAARLLGGALLEGLTLMVQGGGRAKPCLARLKFLEVERDQY